MAIKNYLINDKWLDIDKQNIVEVKSTDGVIGSVKLNGEEYGGSGGGGESDFSTAEVTFNATKTPVEQGEIYSIVYIDEESNISVCEVLRYDHALNDQPLLKTILYQGKYIIRGRGVNSVQGSASMVQVPDDDLYIITITGDCTITIS